MELTTEHEELQRSALKFGEDEINRYVDEWEENEIFPAHEPVSYTHLTLPTT